MGLINSELEYVTITQLAALLEVPVCTMISTRQYLDGFPSPIVRGKNKLYAVAEIQAWAKGIDPGRVIRDRWREVDRKIKAGEMAPRRYQKNASLESGLQFSQMARRFISGEFATAEQKEQFAMRRLAARVSKPKTTRISLTFDWMEENQPQKAHHRS